MALWLVCRKEGIAGARGGSWLAFPAFGLPVPVFLSLSRPSISLFHSYILRAEPTYAHTNGSLPLIPPPRQIGGQDHKPRTQAEGRLVVPTIPISSSPSLPLLVTHRTHCATQLCGPLVTRLPRFTSAGNVGVAHLLTHPSHCASPASQPFRTRSSLFHTTELTSATGFSSSSSAVASHPLCARDTSARV